MRLRDGVDPSNGRVEYCRHRTWGTVCSEGWDDSDARVVCSQLGYNPDGMFANLSFFYGITLNKHNCSYASVLKQFYILCGSQMPEWWRIS